MDLNVYTVVSWASAHSRVSAHVPHFKGSMQQLLYNGMEVMSRVSAHVGQNCKVHVYAWALTRDTMVHANLHVSAISGYTYAAAISRQSALIACLGGGVGGVVFFHQDEYMCNCYRQDGC